MSTTDNKFQQKAVKQPKQKKPKSAEFLMGKDERANAEGIENPAFDGSGTGISTHRAREGTEMRSDRQDSTLAAHQHETEQPAPSEPRGNEHGQNYFDLLKAEESNPRRCVMEVGLEDELELKLMREDENALFCQMTKILDEDDATTIIDLPGALRLGKDMEQEAEVKTWGHRKTAQEEGIPRYVEQLKESMQNDMLTLGSLPLEQAERSKTVQPMEVRLRCLRAVRDKLPRGRYTLRVALRNRLGGCTLHWSQISGQLWAGTTAPVAHGGGFLDTELHFNQSLFTTLPPANAVLPCTILLFELLSLPGELSHVSAVVGWGAFPICDCSFNVVQGKFKTPLLRGSPVPALDQFRKIEDLMSADLDNWLSNLYFQVKKLPRGDPSGEEVCVAPPFPPPTWPRQEAGSEDREGPLGGWSLSPAAHSRCSSVSLRGKDSSQAALENAEQTSDSFLLKREPGMPYKNNPTNRMNSSNTFHPPLLGEKRDLNLGLSAEDLEEYTFTTQPQHPCSRRAGGGAAEHTHLALRMFPSELGLSPWRSPELCLVTLLLTLIWLARLYLHYCSQWLFLQAIGVPVNKFHFRLHTVELVYQNSLLHTREELAMVVVGPLTLNAVTLLLVLIRWGCQLIFGSLPSFLSKFIMALGLWTVLDPLAVFAVDAILGRLANAVDRPIADAAKLPWHFQRMEHSIVPGILLTVFLYAVHFILSTTILYIYFLRLHNDGRMLDIFQRLHSKDGVFFVPQDLEVSNQELNYIVKKAEQWRGLSGERRKVAVYDYIWTEDPSVGASTSICDPQRGSSRPPGAETSTHVSIYTLHLGGFQELYRHFLRQPNGAIVEVIGDLGSVEPPQSVVLRPVQKSAEDVEACASHQLRERKKKKTVWRSHRVEPAGRSCTDSTAALKLVSH